MATPPTGVLSGDLGNALGASPSGAGTLWLTPPQVVAYASAGYTLTPSPVAVPVGADGQLSPTAVARTDLGNPAGWAYNARVDVPGLPAVLFRLVVVAASQDLAAGIVSAPGEPLWVPTVAPHSHPEHATQAELAAAVSAAVGSASGWVSVASHGAVGNGVADDTAAIIAAMTAAGPEGAVFFPQGTYKITATLNIPKTQQWIGFTPSQNTPASTTSTTIRSTVAGVAIFADSSNLQGLRIEGPGAGVAGSVGVQLKGAATIRDCSFYDFETAIGMDQCWYAVIDRVFTRYNGVGAKINYCYNVSLSDFRVSCASRTAGQYGQGITMTDRSMVTMHGGSIEHYTVGVKIDGGNQSFVAVGLYQESYSAGAIGVQMMNGKSVATVVGSQVYLDNHAAWIHAGAGTAGGCSITALGNKFKTTKDAGTTTYAYMLGATTGLTASGDDWGNVTFAGYTYRNAESAGPSIIADPLGTTKPNGQPGGGVSLSGSAPVSIENNRGVRLASGGLPSTALDGEVRIDPADGKLKFRWGGSWRTVTSS